MKYKHEVVVEFTTDQKLVDAGATVRAKLHGYHGDVKMQVNDFQVKRKNVEVLDTVADKMTSEFVSMLTARVPTADRQAIGLLADALVELAMRHVKTVEEATPKNGPE